MTTISERLRRPLVDGVERMPGTCCAEAADTIDALVAALEEARGAIFGLAEQQAITDDFYIATVAKIDAARALARGGK